MVFTNKYKSENPKAPDFILYEASDRTQENSNSQAEATTAQPAEDQTSDIPDMLEAWFLKNEKKSEQNSKP